MLFFKKKNAADKTKEDSDLIKQNDKRIEALIVLARENRELINRLREVQEKIRYLTPRADAKVMEFDQKIKEQIEDLKIRMVKDEDAEKALQAAERTILQIGVLISDRNALII